jgi:polyhydroxyalkanoate synthesis regulator phasin
MKKRTKIAAGAGAALAIAGAGGAVAADRITPKAESEAIVADAAKQLGVEPARLTAALKQALKNRVDEAVKAGRLTQQQGTAMKERIDAGAFPFLAGPGLGFRGGGERGFHHRGGGHLDAAASYLGVSAEALRTALEDGKSLADVAKENGKAVDALVDALVADETKELADAVADGRLTDAQRDEIASTLEQRITDFVNGVRPAFGMGRHRHELPAPAPGDA